MDKINNTKLIEQAVQALDRGEVVGIPTDTVYGLATKFGDPAALERLFVLKRRPRDRKIAVLVASAQMAEELIELNSLARDLISAHWPGALTLVGQKRPGVFQPEDKEGRKTLGVRMPNQIQVVRICEQVGPLSVTSANLSGLPPVCSNRQAEEIFGDQISVYVPGIAAGGSASTVVDVSSDPPIILRNGPIQIASEALKSA